MTFAHPILLWLLAIPALFLLATAFSRSRRASDPLPKIPRASLRSGRWSLLVGQGAFLPRPLAAGLALALLVLALARPQGATLSTPSFTQARDVLVAVDVSRSMQADDVPPSRLARARLLVRDLADDLRGERLGLLPFAGTAFLQSPLSADYEIFRTFLDELGPDMIPAGGSDFAALLRAAGDAFGPATPPSDAALAPDRYLVVLSDGEAESDAWRPLAQRLAERGVRIIALGLGTPAGAMVPDGKGGLTKDARGAAVLSRLNPATLQELARATGGIYRDASSWVDLPALLKETVARGRASRVGTETAPRRQELFGWFLAPALLILAVSLVREFPPVPRVSTKPLHASAGAVVRVIPLAFAVGCAVIAGRRACAADAPPPPPDPLLSLVEKLSSAPELAAADLARLATLSAERGEQARSQPAGGAAPFPEGAVRDALAAVSAGQGADPKAADWPALRKRLEALLAPPPEQSQEQQSQKPSPQDKKQDQPEKSDDQKSPQEKQSSDQSNGSPKEQENSQSRSSDSKSGSSGDSSSGGQSDSANNEASQSSPRPSGEKPLGDLASSPPSDTPAEESDQKNASAPADQARPESADEPTQQAGGVSASGRPGDADASGDAASLDPALALPQQRLDRVRDSDAPARLFQLLQESETPPEERERRAAGAKQTW